MTNGRRKNPRKPKKRKEPTLQELRKEVREDVKRWKHVKRYGAQDPGHEDGVNLYLLRNHIIYDRGKLRERCRRDRIRPCPPESNVKIPQPVSFRYCAPKSKSGACKERRKRKAAARRKKRRAARKATS